MKKEKILIGIICLVLTLAITLQMRTMAGTDSIVRKSFANDELKDKLLQWEERYESMTKALEKSNNELEEVRTASSQNDSTSKENSEKIKKNNMLLGLTDVVGDGIVITAKDGQIPLSLATDNISQYLIHDSNLRGIVSELKNAGAEAISINGQRIVSNSYISLVNSSIILIDDVKTASPYEIKAIGDKKYLESALTIKGGYIDREKVSIKIDYRVEDNIVIPKYDGEISLKYSKEYKEKEEEAN